MYFFALILAVPALAVTGTTMMHPATQEPTIAAGKESTLHPDASPFEAADHSPPWLSPWAALADVSLPGMDPTWRPEKEGDEFADTF